MPRNAEKFIARIAGVEWDGWEEMSVSRSLQQGAGVFDLKLARKSGSMTLDSAITPGADVTIEIDGQPVLVGWLDALRTTYDATSSMIFASGRDKVGDLVDCAATVAVDFDFRGLKLDAMVKKVAAPFGISVSVDGDVGKAFTILAIQPGERAFAFIERACRFRQLLPVSDGVGGLVLVKPAGEKSPGRIIYGQNVLRGDISFDTKGLYSKYEVLGQTAPLVADTDADNDAELLSTPAAAVSDSNVKRYRPTVIVSENNAVALTLKQRAEWEKKIARARSAPATYTVQGWYASEDQLWKVNTVVHVTDERAGLDRDMLITDVNFSRDKGGTTTQLGMTLPEAFDILPYRNDASTDPIWAPDPDGGAK
ncbi:MAG: hypothetical protein GC185_01905 [Alphaproteobacteria bacterium]|nr:hypothetical protein [Alphaproteobacteria bacterium]